MHSRFFSVVCLFVFIVFSSNTLYAQVNPPTTTQCSDGLDNDTDGKVDFGGTNPDPGCSSATDTDETNSSVAVNITFPFCLPACLDGQSCSTTCPLVCPAGSTRTPTPESPVCFLTITPTTSPAGTVFSLSGYSHLTGNCTLASSAAQTTPVSPILPSGGSLGLVVSSTVSSVTAATAATFTTTAQAASILTCPSGAPVCSLGAG